MWTLDESTCRIPLRHCFPDAPPLYNEIRPQETRIHVYDQTGLDRRGCSGTKKQLKNHSAKKLN